jgi:hypothetical protein
VAPVFGPAPDRAIPEALGKEQRQENRGHDENA